MADPATLIEVVHEVGPWAAFSAFLAWEMREVRRERRRERTTWRDRLEEMTDEVRGLRSDVRASGGLAADGGRVLDEDDGDDDG